MLTRQDIATFDPRYRRYRAELRWATAADGETLARWVKSQGDRLVQAWIQINPDGSALDFENFLREQYARAHGFFPLDHTNERDDNHVDSNSTHR